MRGSKYYNPNASDSASNFTFLMQPYFEPHLFHAVTYFEPRISHAVTYFYFKPHISHATPRWLQNHANIIFDIIFQTKFFFKQFVMIFYAHLKRIMKKKSFCGGVPLNRTFCWLRTKLDQLKLMAKVTDYQRLRDTVYIFLYLK